MKKEINVCDNCKNETNEVYSKLGWIHINNCGFHISGKRLKSGLLNTLFYSHEIKTNNVLDFCCIDCFIEWLLKQFNVPTIENYNELIENQEDEEVKDYLKHIRLKYLNVNKKTQFFKED